MAVNAAEEEAERGRMLAEGDAVWARLCHALDARPDQSLHAAPAPEWTSRDVYAHLARWQANTVHVVGELRAGRPAPTIEGDDDTINARWAAEDAGLTVAEARTRCLESRGALREALLQLSAEEWDRFGRLCAEDVAGPHYQDHLDAIQR
jgi:hypothetical protein